MVQLCGYGFTKSVITLISDKQEKSHLRKYLWERSGIYRIYNKISGNCYIGLAKNLYKRCFYGHLHDLRKGTHGYTNGSIDILQKAWNKYGENAFEFQIMEYCPTDRLQEREIFWIDYYNCNNRKSGKGYNLTDGGNQPPSDGRGTRGRKTITNGTVTRRVLPEELESYLNNGWHLGMSISDKEIHRKALLKRYEQEREQGIIRKHSVETRRKMQEAKRLSDYPGRRPGEFHHTEESKLKISAAKKGKTQSPESNEKRRQTLLNKNIHHSHESIEKIIKSKEKPVLQFTLEGEFVARYDSGQKAAQATGEDAAYICVCCKNQRKRYKNSIWRFENEQQLYLEVVDQRKLSCVD